jgi:fibronectin type 3 domain-containing protein
MLGGSGATVTLSGAGNAVTIATSAGAYSFTGLANGAYTVTPSNTGYTFTPVSQNATLSGVNITGLNFTAAVVQPHTATANWTASTSVVSGYNVYRGTVSGGPYTKLNSSLIGGLTYADTTVQSARTYFYVTTSVDGSGIESVFSNEGTAVIP